MAMTSLILDFHALTELLEAAPPLLLLDIAEIAEDGKAAYGRRAVSIAEAVFQGHFPGNPVLPGVLQVTAMTQLAKVLLLKGHTPGIAAQRVTLKQVHRLKFRKPVLPGMVMSVEAKVVAERPESAETDFQVSCTTEQGLASAGTITLQVLAELPDGSCRTPRKVLERPASPFADEIAALKAHDAAELMTILPHRPPFLLLDKAYGIGENDGKIYGIKNLSACDRMLAGSATGIYPFPLMLEAAAQLGCAHILSQPGNAGKLGIFLCIDDAHFYAQAKVGDQLLIAGHCDTGSRAGTAEGELWVDDIKIADCAMKFILLDALK